jgi:uncharacterized protein with GYD domain
MPRCLGLFKYSHEGAKGFMKEKAEAREAEVRKIYEGIGGKVEAMYWAVGGEHTGVVIAELPDAATGAAFGMVLDASGALDAIKTIEMLTSSELDRALAKTITYRPPGA